MVVGTEVWFLVGVLAGGGTVWLAQRGQVGYLRRELAVAQDRLLHAWKDGAIIAPRPLPAPEPIETLPEALQALVTEWESAESRATMDAKLRSLYFGQGMGIPAILRKLELERT